MPLGKERGDLRGATTWNEPANTGTLAMLGEAVHMDMDWYSMSRALARGAAGNGAEAVRDTAMGAETSADDGPSRPSASVSGAGVGAEMSGALVIQTGSEDDNNGYLCMFISAGSSKASNQGPCWPVSLELILFESSSYI